MDVNAVRSRLLTGFKPKEKDIDTPYLEELDGELKLVGLTGKQRIALEEQASTETTDKEGNTTSKVDSKKFLALALAQCLRLRSTGEPIFSAIDVLGPMGKGDGVADEMDSDAYIQLLKQVSEFIGNRSAKATKNGSNGNENDLPASSLPQDSTEQSMNSLTESTQQN